MSLAKRGDTSRKPFTDVSCQERRHDQRTVTRLTQGLSAQSLSTSCWEMCAGREYLVLSIQKRFLIIVVYSFVHGEVGVYWLVDWLDD